MEKTFSCSNTSKNAVQYITIRTISFISPGSAFRPLPLFWPRFFSGKRCKDKCLFSNHQIFLKEFFRIFSEPFFVSLQTVCCIRSGCKGKAFFDNFQIFLKDFFRKTFLKNLAFQKYFLHQSGCKVTTYFRNMQIIFDFSSQFSKRKYSRLTISFLCCTYNIESTSSHKPAVHPYSTISSLNSKVKYLPKP